MTYVIAEPCVGVKAGSCADVCPVDCKHTSPDADMFFIDPAECIDCGVCVPECPVDAIYPDNELPVDWARFTWINSAPFGLSERCSRAAPSSSSQFGERSGCTSTGRVDPPGRARSNVSRVAGDTSRRPHLGNKQLLK